MSMILLHRELFWLSKLSFAGALKLVSTLIFDNTAEMDLTENSTHSPDGGLRENSICGDCLDKAFVEQRIINNFRKAAT